MIGSNKTQIDAAILRELDLGESSVIVNALTHAIDTVAIDEKAARRLARIHGLKVTGSLGILLKARRHSLIPSIGDCIGHIRDRCIWISADLITEALRRANEGCLLKSVDSFVEPFGLSLFRAFRVMRG